MEFLPTSIPAISSDNSFTMSETKLQERSISFVVEVEHQPYLVESMESYTFRHGTYATEQEALDAADTAVEELNRSIAIGVLELEEDRRAQEGWIRARWRATNGYVARVTVYRE